MSTGDDERGTAAARILGLALAAARAHGRDDLVARLEARCHVIADPGVTLVVLGEFKQGKSTLVNALLGIDRCPVDDDIATVIPTVVRHGDADSAQARVAGTDDEAGDGDDDAAGPVIALPPDRVAETITGATDAGAGRVASVELTVPRKLLASGLAVVDTPGVGGLVSAHGAAAMGALHGARAVVFVTDASQELTAPELDAVRRAHALCPDVALALTKIDIHPDWRRIAELDRRHLERAGLDVPLFPVSSLIREHAIATGDTATNVESGFPPLLEWLRTDVLARSEEALARAAAREADEVATQLAAQFEAELRILEAPDRAASVLDELEAARRHAETLESGAARWQTALADGATDLTADVDHDLRARFRRAMSLADERIDDADPAEIWDEFEPWLRQLLTEEVAANHALLVDRASSLASDIAALFAADAEPSPVGDLGGPSASLERVEIDIDLDIARASLLDTGLGVLRGGYGGMLMFGMLASMVGITLVAPASVAIGLVMGRKQQREEQRRQLQQRRQAAKQTYRTYVDEVSFVVSKQSRDTLRHLHRHLRDGWAERARELQRSARDALRAAEEAARTATADVEDRRAALRAELARIDALRTEVGALCARGTRSP